MNSSFISSTWFSRARIPSRRAISANFTMSRMTSEESTDLKKNAFMKTLWIFSTLAKGNESTIAPTVPPTTTAIDGTSISCPIVPPPSTMPAMMAPTATTSPMTVPMSTPDTSLRGAAPAPNPYRRHRRAPPTT